MSREEMPGLPNEVAVHHPQEQRPHDLTESPTRITMNRGLSIEEKLETLSVKDKHKANVNVPTLQNHHRQNHLSTVTTIPTANTVNTSHHHHDHHLQQQNGTGGSSSSSNTNSLLSFGWLDRQRERRRRQNLQQQAEEQLQKIVQAELARKAAADHHHCLGEHLIVANMPPPYRVSRNPSVSSKSSEELSLDRSTTTGRKIAAADVSKSGEGATAHLDLSDVLGMAASTEDEDCDEEDEFPAPPVRVDALEIDKDNPFILDEHQMHAIASHVLPKTIAFCRWRRLYGLNRDGDSFDACLRIIGPVQRTLMVIRTSKGEIFGGYADAPWHPNDKGGSAGFYGSAAACLFAFSDTYTPKRPNRKTKISYRVSNDNNTNNNETDDSATSTTRTTSQQPPFSYINVFRWTGKNRYIQLCDVHTKMIAFGGGGTDGAFGVCVQDDFQRGSTGPCDTFDNDPLCDGGSFDVVDVEFWEFLTGMF
ncbi:TLD domain containing protein [Nitzschia inconspicua]|uniref:Oxidation resistance protein 1 n=1 Tax=Nitzschia inconspicua TaxID=303405 RepID=A0A9K3KK54_9STRA|nr:TLD domain containing protein [Nitzschia inconspicua]